MDSSSRGFELTGLTNYVQAYWRAAREIQNGFDHLGKLIADNPEQVRKLEGIRAQFSRWSNRATLMLERLPPNQKIETEVLEAGREEFAQFISGFDDFVRIELGLREQRNNALQRLDRNIRAW